MTTRNREQTPFGRKLQALRLRARLTQPQLAERSGLSAGIVQSLEQGLRDNPTLQTIRLLADALGVSATELIDES